MAESQMGLTSNARISDGNGILLQSAPGTLALGLTKVFWILLCVFAGATAIASLAEPAGEFDDAIPLLHGMLIQQGRTPNLDFYSFYPPLGPYLTAATFKLFGQTILAPR